MSVQPLKSIAIAALALGASLQEIRLAALLLAACCLLLSAGEVDRLAARIPVRLIHGLQLGLGVILAVQGVHFLSDPAVATWQLVLVAPLLALILLPSLAPGLGPTRFLPRLPLLGIVAGLGLLWAVLHGLLSPCSASLYGSRRTPAAPCVLRWSRRYSSRSCAHAFELGRRYPRRGPARPRFAPGA